MALSPPLQRVASGARVRMRPYLRAFGLLNPNGWVIHQEFAAGRTSSTQIGDGGRLGHAYQYTHRLRAADWPMASSRRAGRFGFAPSWRFTQAEALMQRGRRLVSVQSACFQGDQPSHGACSCTGCSPPINEGAQSGLEESVPGVGAESVPGWE